MKNLTLGADVGLTPTMIGGIEDILMRLLDSHRRKEPMDKEIIERVRSLTPDQQKLIMNVVEEHTDDRIRRSRSTSRLEPDEPEPEPPQARKERRLEIAALALGLVLERRDEPGLCVHRKLHAGHELLRGRHAQRQDRPDALVPLRPHHGIVRALPVPRHRHAQIARRLRPWIVYNRLAGADDGSFLPKLSSLFTFRSQADAVSQVDL